MPVVQSMCPAATRATTSRRDRSLVQVPTMEILAAWRGHAGYEPEVFRFGVPRHSVVVYRSCMSPTVAVSTAQSEVGTVGRCAPRGSLGGHLRGEWCGC
jgi:hypothetical protein